MLEFLQRHTAALSDKGDSMHKAHLAGNSIHVDRAFLHRFATTHCELKWGSDRLFEQETYLSSALNRSLEGLSSLFQGLHLYVACTYLNPLHVQILYS